MKNFTFILLIVLISLFIINCDSSTKSKTESQVAILTLYHENESLDIELALFNDPMSNLESFKINGDQINLNKYYNDGSISYYNTIQDKEINNGVNKLSIDMKTDIGTLNTIIDKPDQTTIESIPDSVNCSESINIDMIGNADFYSIFYIYEYKKDSGHISSSWESISNITDNSISLSNDLFNYNGIISYLVIYSVNGIFPDENTAGNIHGDGGGFVQYSERIIELINPTIVGEGTGITSNFNLTTVQTKAKQLFIEQLNSQIIKGEK